MSFRCCMALVSVLALLAACGPNSGNRDGGPDAYTGPTGTINGTVWAPGNAPGMVPAGHEIPVFGALVWLTYSRAPGIPTQAYCDLCVDTPGASATTDHQGHFSMGNIVPGNYWINIQKGQFRLEQQVLVGPNEVIDLPVQNSTLPSVHDPANGQWIPKIALVDGKYDRLEDVLGKMGLGQVNGSGSFVGPSAIGAFDLYSSTNRYAFSNPNPYVGDAMDLLGNPVAMNQYHIIFVPCDASGYSYLLDNPAVRAAVSGYVALGGKLYVTDWSAEWEDGVFPEFVIYQSDHDTSAVTNINDGDGSPGYTAQSARADDMDLNLWLDGQEGPRTDGTVGTFDANSFEIIGNWNHIVSLPRILIGQDQEGFDVYEEAHAWVLGDWDGDGIMHPLTVTFEPTGCGRVLYTTYHTTEGAHVGLVPQERILLYLIMEIGECHDGPVVVE